MKKQVLLLVFALVSISNYAQIHFEKGYYINNTGQKIVCLIKNLDWKNNPTKFKYKKTENATLEEAMIQNTREFGIDGESKYIRSTVKIDRSSENINNLDDKRTPDFKEEQLFLKVLVEGKASLYKYEDSNLKRYFYDTDSTDITQLIFKKYKTPLDKIGKNERFKQQLWKTLQCSSISLTNVENLDYKERSLAKFFTTYNTCIKGTSIGYSIKEKRDLFNLTIRPRLNNSSLAIKNAILDFKDTDFGSKTNFGIGIEAELILPFNKNKWGIFVEPNYYSLHKEVIGRDKIFNEEISTKVSYSSIDFAFGARHYFFLNNKSRIFLNAFLSINLAMESSIKFSNENTNPYYTPLEITTQNNWGVGAGYKYNDISLELRYQLNREFLNYFYWSTDHNIFSVVVGYTLF